MDVVALGILLALGVFAFEWGVVHGTCELITWAFHMSWEPSAMQTLGVALGLFVARSVVRSQP